ncbi:MAG: hypothetical protein AVDCRST_MAG56-1836 [uncultured Cytophagales bacterium]|uniref:Uncharacterized protein n=1 Tax=uncultured Cytophagales bacterium TaxID=158755 RepID=A0A6J4IF44_9SPHI|nr:MAG: hypothetical protein AVDCRST_MAG56-1836 [uncultured Cytophagales bacterium]
MNVQGEDNEIRIPYTNALPKSGNAFQSLRKAVTLRMQNN